jgi:hypothetical protein
MHDPCRPVFLQLFLSPAAGGREALKHAAQPYETASLLAVFSFLRSRRGST